MKVLANTLVCKMEPSKVRVQELTLVYYAVRSLVPMEGIEEPADDVWPQPRSHFLGASRQPQDEAVPVNGSEKGDDRESTWMQRTSR